MRTLVAQRIAGISLGYEDLNDHDDLRHDPLLALLSGKLEARRKDCAPLAGKSTLSRLEHAPAGGKPSRYAKIDHDPEKLQDVLAESFIDSWQGLPPSRLVLDIDSTDDEVHGRQEGRSFHGYYNHYCFLPLYITCGGRPLFALLRPGSADPAGGVTGPLGRIVARLRQEWPWLKILLRADSAYARDELMTWCKDNDVDYVIGLAKNSRLVERIGWELADAAAEAERKGRPARRFAEFPYATSSPPSGKRFMAPNWLAPQPERSGSSSSRSVPASWSRCDGSKSPWTPHTLPPQRSQGSTRDYRGRHRPLPTFSTLRSQDQCIPGPMSAPSARRSRRQPPRKHPRGLLPPTPTPLTTRVTASPPPS